jgi:hypothetical protein
MKKSLRDATFPMWMETDLMASLLLLGHTSVGQPLGIFTMLVLTLQMVKCYTIQLLVLPTQDALDASKDKKYWIYFAKCYIRN